MINKTVEAALNEQINAEFYSSFLYLSMASYLDNMGLAGFSNWMLVQAEEEQDHAMRFFKYITERGGRVTLKTIEVDQTEFGTLIELFTKVLEHEQKVTSLINNLMDIAITNKDHASKSFLQWFVDEQVEEEASVEEMINNLKLINGEGQGLLMMDREAAARVFTPSAK